MNPLPPLLRVERICYQKLIGVERHRQKVEEGFAGTILKLIKGSQSSAELGFLPSPF